MSFRSKEVVKAIETVESWGCEVSRNHHQRVTYNGVFLGTLGHTPGSVRSMANSLSSIRARLVRLKSTGRTW